MASAYTPAQLSQYFERIELPSHLRQTLTSPTPTPTLAHLTALFQHHITRIPHENLSLHYTPPAPLGDKLSLDPQSLFAKIITCARGRGGYCMENAILFHHVLLATNFNVYLAGARIRPRSPNNVPSGAYMGWVHSVNIVTLPDGSKYVCDVSFGGDGPVVPLPMLREPRDGEEVVQNIGQQEVRMVYGNVQGQRRLESKWWVYEYRNGRDREWNAYYCFGEEAEWMLQDFEVMNFYTSESPQSFTTYTVVAVRFLGREREREKEGEVNGEGGVNGSGGMGEIEVYGKVMLRNADLKRNLGGKTELVKSVRTEEERVGVLKEYFGIDLTEEEKEGIRGRYNELPMKE